MLSKLPKEKVSKHKYFVPSHFYLYILAGLYQFVSTVFVYIFVSVVVTVLLLFVVNVVFYNLHCHHLSSKCSSLFKQINYLKLEATHLVIQAVTQVIIQVVTRDIIQVVTQVISKEVTLVIIQVVTQVITQVITRVISKAVTLVIILVVTRVITQVTTQVIIQVVTQMEIPRATQVAIQVAMVPNLRARRGLLLMLRPLKAQKMSQLRLASIQAAQDKVPCFQRKPLVRNGEACIKNAWK